MKNKLNQVRMDYLYRNEWKTKDTTMSELCQQVKEGKYLRLVKGVRGEEAVITRAGLGIQNVAASDLPKVWPAWETSGGYTAACCSHFVSPTTDNCCVGCGSV